MVPAGTLLGRHTQTILSATREGGEGMGAQLLQAVASWVDAPMILAAITRSRSKGFTFWDGMSFNTRGFTLLSDGAEPPGHICVHYVTFEVSPVATLEDLTGSFRSWVSSFSISLNLSRTTCAVPFV
jgi:hypothetical protein